VTHSRPWLALVLLAVFATACSDGGIVEPSSLDSGGLTLSAPTAKGDYSISLNHVSGGFRKQNDKFTARNGTGVNASGTWKARIINVNGDIETAGEITCLGHVDSKGVRLGGVVVESSDPALIGATMIATVHDGNPDRSTGLRVYTEGFDALKHCTDGYPTASMTLNGEVTWQAIRTGFVLVN
jgi:hypothetical protein